MSKPTQLKFNDPAPDVELVSTLGARLRLSALWQAKVLVLAFTRHFGCPQCKEMVDQLLHYTPAMAQRGITLAVVTQGGPEESAAFCAERLPGVTCLCDPERAAYRAYGLGRGTPWQILLSPRIWISNRRLQAGRGWRPELPPAGQDVWQMSGTFIIGPDGRVRMPYYYADIADHPPVDLLLSGVMGADWGRSFDEPISPAA